MQLLVGLCSKIAHATDADQVPAVREALGRISSSEAMIAGMVNGQINAFEEWPGGDYGCFNRRMMYAALEWCTQNFSKFVDELRELCGGGVFQVPANISVMRDPDLARDFQTYWQTPHSDAGNGREHGHLSTGGIAVP
jgi:4-hydroxyphenylacetate 3-monooxygenase